MKRRIVPDIVPRQEVTTMAATATVQDAAEMMAGRRIGAVVISGGRGVDGIVTERDVLTRVVAKQLDPKATPLSAVMTKNPDTVSPDSSAADALQKMATHGYRHLPVVEDGSLVAMVSIRDLYAAVTEQLEAELESRDAFMFGEGYGVSA
ncbi:MAG: CBS domain-containing protein [Pseudomonadota bacterium]